MILENNSIRDLINYSFEKTNTPKQVLDQLMHFFNTNEKLKESFSKTTVIHDNEMMTLVPAAVFEEEHLN